MTEQKRPSLAALNADLHSLTKSVDGLAADVEEIKAPKVDFEAGVAGRCATALDALSKAAEARSGTGNYSSGYLTTTSYGRQPVYQEPTGPVARVLDYLRQRYGLPNPDVEARRLSAELERACGRIGELESRLEQIRGATS